MAVVRVLRLPRGSGTAHQLEQHIAGDDCAEAALSTPRSSTIRRSRFISAAIALATAIVGLTAASANVPKDTTGATPQIPTVTRPSHAPVQHDGFLLTRNTVRYTQPPPRSAHRSTSEALRRGSRATATTAPETPTSLPSVHSGSRTTEARTTGTTGTPTTVTRSASTTAAPPTARAHTRTSSPPSPKPMPPLSGVVLGAYVDLPGLTQSSSMQSRESQLGITYGIDSHYYDWTDPFPSHLDVADVAAGRTPMDTWWGTSLASINNGSQDTVIKAAAARVKAFGKPMFIRWAAEMNGDWYQWSGSTSTGGPAAYVAAWRHIHDLFAAAGVTNVAWVWAPNADSHPGGVDPTSPNSWRHYYPGDAYVDWVGIDGYNRGTTPNENWQSFASIFGPVYHDYAGRKPIMIAETSSVDVGGSKGAWISAAVDWIRSHPAIRALVWFDTNLSSSRVDWRADSSAGSWSAFTKMAHNPYFEARIH